MFIGGDGPVGAGWRAGGAFDCTDSSALVRDLNSTSDILGYTALLYAGRAIAAGPGKLNVLVGGALTWHDIDTKRYVSVAGTSQKLKANYGGHTKQVFTEVGYALPLTDAVTVEPFAGVAWSGMRHNAYTEKGGLAALSGERSDDCVTTTSLGLRAKTGLKIGLIAAELRGMVGWRHAFGDLKPFSKFAFEGSQTFIVAGAPIAKNAAWLEMGAHLPSAIKPRWV